ncbi:uncharacterized protein LOC125643174 isoform X3 [Caretta caretta]|uniref:uncharacterized protein LOC125643174 isoform X3 n=1 Tax=Caretta caretta TaxID=8467 RepID=UPI003F4B0583
MAEGGDAAAEEWLWLLGAGSAGLQRHPASRAAPPARPGRASWAGANGRPGERTRSPTASGAESCAGPQRCLTGTGPHGNRNTRPGATNQEPGTWEPRDRNNGAGTEASGTVLLRNSMMSDWDRTIREQEPPIRSHKSGTWEPRDRNTGAGTEVSGTGIGISTQNSNGRQRLREQWDSHPQCNTLEVDDSPSTVEALRRVNALGPFCVGTHTIDYIKTISKKPPSINST